MGAMASVAALTSASDEDVHKFIAAALQNDRAGALRVIKTAAAIAKLEVSVLNGADGNALPEGVQLTSLGSSSADPAAVRSRYESAFRADAGESREALTHRLTECVSAVAQRQHSTSSHSAWQSYGLSEMVAMTTQGRLRAYGEAALEGFVRSLGDAGLVLHVASPKDPQRAAMKAQIKYAGDVSNLCDLNRATVECASAAQLVQAVERLASHFDAPEAHVAEIEDFYLAGEMAEGYRHLQAVVCLRGVLWEVQFNTTTILAAKHAGGHSVYKTTRHVRESLLLLAMRGDVEGLRELLGASPGVRDVADPNAVRDKHGLLGLHHAAVRGDEEMARELFGLGADVWALDRDDNCALFYATLFGHEAVAALCLAAMRSSAGGGGAQCGDAHERHWALTSCLAFRDLSAEARGELDQMLRELGATPHAYVAGRVSAELKVAATAIRRPGVPFSYRGYHKEGEDLFGDLPPDKFSLYNVRFAGVLRADGTFDGSLFWFNLQSRWSKKKQDVDWQPEHVKGTITGTTVRCKGIAVGEQLVACEYSFEILDGGLRIQDFSFHPAGTKHDYAYMKKATLLLEHPKIPAPSEFCRLNYFDKAGD